MTQDEQQKETRVAEFFRTRYSTRAYRIKRLSDGSIAVGNLAMHLLGIATTWEELQEVLSKPEDEVVKDHSYTLHRKAVEERDQIATIDVGDLDL